MVRPGHAFIATPVAAMFLSAGWRYIAIAAVGRGAAFAPKSTPPGTVAATS